MRLSDSASPPPRGLASGRLMRMAGIVGMLVGGSIVAGTATGIYRPLGDHGLGYMVGGLTAAYGLFRYLRGRSAGIESRRSRPSRYER